MPRDHRSRGNRPVRNWSPGCWEHPVLHPTRPERLPLQALWGSWQTSGMGTSRTSVRATRSRVASVLATLVRIVGGLAVLVLVAHIVLTLGDANPANGITRLVAAWADRLQIGFRGLFNPADPRTRIVVNYGLAAAFWLVVSWVLVRLLQRLA